jgi:hypothetical protein
MKKKTKALLSVLLVLTLLVSTFVFAPGSAQAATTPVDIESTSLSVWADPEGVLTQQSVTDFSGGNKLATLGGIRPHAIAGSSGSGIGGCLGGGGSTSSNYYWFFPSNADLTALKVWFNTSTTVKIGNETLTSGGTTSAFAAINEGGVSQNYTLTIGSSSYTLVAIKSGDVGTVYVDTNSGSLSTIYNSSEHTTSEAGSVMVVQPDGTVDYLGEMEKFSGRGNGTWDDGNAKNPFNLKLAVSTSLLGLPKAKKWCLLANSGDSTLVKNQLTYDFAAYVGVKYQPRCKPVDLYVNQNYLGSYQLSEKVQIKSNRIDITDSYENLEIANGTTDPQTGAIIPADFNTNKPTVTCTVSSTSGANARDHTVGAKKYSTGLTNPSEYDGGYLYELEISNRWVDENAGFCAYNRQGWVMKNCDYATQQMVEYSYDLLYAMGSAVYNGGTVPSGSTTTTCSSLSQTTTKGANSITNPAPASTYRGQRWSDILDADSAVRYYWTQEFFKNMDSSTSSTYFYKDLNSIDTKVYAGPVWDMDNTIGINQSGSRWGYSYTSADGWYTKMARIYRWRSSDSTMTYSSDSYSPLNFYAALATNCTDFWSLAERYWHSTVSPAVDVLTGSKTDPNGILKSTAEYVNTVNKSAQMNAVRFGTSYNASTIISDLNNWFTTRNTWINNQIPTTAIQNATFAAIPNQTYTGNPVTPEVSLTYQSMPLVEGVDYTVEYTDNVNAGTAYAVVTGLGYFTSVRDRSFTIQSVNISSGFTLDIPASTYKDTSLTAVLTNTATGATPTSSLTYQWYRDGIAISGATQAEYLTTSDDSGTTLTCVATGDGNNFTGSCTSNACTVLPGERPEGYTRTIASWQYNYTTAPDALVNADASGDTYYYTATGGENQATSNLYASVNASDTSKIKWSGSADLFATDGVSDQAPVTGTSKTDTLAWGAYPYFETVVSTAGYEDIHFSARLGGTKKGPRDWKLQYSLDGTNYTDVSGATYSITNNKAMELAFDDVALPDACTNQLAVYIRMVVTNDIAINGTNTIINQLSGDAAVNDILVTGASLSIVTSLYAPTVTDGCKLRDDELVTISDNNGGADVYYSVNDGAYALYSEPFNPFNAATAKIGDTATVKAYSNFDAIDSDVTTETFVFAGVDINSFAYETFSQDVTGGAVRSTGGVYDKSGRMTAYTDGNSQYVPLWRDDNGSFVVSPDDGARWSADSGFTYKVSTAGFENIAFFCQGYTTAQGPKSVTLQYSLDGSTFYNVSSNTALAANKQLEQVYDGVQLPAACSNQRTVYIRLATTENMTNGGGTLHNNDSKGNLYINNVYITGEDTGAFKMPYTNKSTSYFGDTGVIKYVSPDGLPMQYIVTDSHNTVVQSGTYPSAGIQLSTVSGFDSTAQEPYTIAIEAVEDEDTSLVNSATYYYKGDTVVKFNYNDTTKLFADYVAADGYSVSSTSGVNSGTLAMYPAANTSAPAALSYTNTYGVKVEFSADNRFTAPNNNLDNPSGRGYWLITTSSLGYTNLTLNLEQLSSNKGPRDWGIAYSTNGSSYTYVANSNARAISNDASSDTVETYGNLALPAACDNQQTLYIKVFINGAETVDGNELNDEVAVTKGNTGINTIELSGVQMPAVVTFNTTALESPSATTGTIGVAGVEVYVNGSLRTTSNANGVATVNLPKNTEAQIELRGACAVPRTVTLTPTGDVTQNVPLLVLDRNADGYINAKDFAIIHKDQSLSSYESFFANFINVKTSEFSYQ